MNYMKKCKIYFGDKELCEGIIDDVIFIPDKPDKIKCFYCNKKYLSSKLYIIEYKDKDIKRYICHKCLTISLKLTKKDLER